MVPNGPDKSLSLLNMPPSTTGATAQGSFSTKPTPKDPYQYQVGFGNRFASEALYVTFHYLSRMIVSLRFDYVGQAFSLRARTIHRRTSMVCITKGQVLGMSYHQGTAISDVIIP
jgi:hypothetical protein